MTPEIEKHLSAFGTMKKRSIVINNFLGGLAWGVGSVLGATIVISIVFGIMRNFNFLPIIGPLFDEAIEQRSPKMVK